MMKFLLLLFVVVAVAHGFTSIANRRVASNSIVSRARATKNEHRLLMSSTEGGAAAATETASEEAPAAVIEQQEIPTYLPSDCGIDYVPFAAMLATGDFEGADQFARDALIKIAGPDAKKREYVYFTEVPNLPSTDLCTMERLWLQFSNGAFGYSVQKRVWDIEGGNFDAFIRRIGWTTVENDSERKLRWYGKSEFIYELTKAPKGHLPLTSALRGTQLMRKLMEHPVWTEYDWKNYKNLKWEP
jgi:hypothetical protein